MALYSNAYKSMCAKLIIGISCLVCLFGLITAIFGALQMGAIQAPSEFSSYAPQEGGTGKAVLALGVIIIITSMLGCATAKFKKPCFAILFIILCGVLGLVMVIVGALAAFPGNAVFTMAADQACSVDNSYDSYRDIIDSKMCTDACPCNFNDKGQW